jgi:hypothetical protein
MRYKNGAPIKLYVVTDQESGDSQSFISMKAARTVAKWLNVNDKKTVVLTTYVQEPTK